jgi:hypothetical protein
MRQASLTRIYVPLEFATRAWHLAEEGEPLLREARASDVHTLLACDESDGFGLGLAEWHEEVGGITTFKELAAFLGLSRVALIAVCEARGANVLLPDPEDEDDSIADPYEYLDALADLCPVPTLDEKMRELPEVFTLSPLDRLEALKARTTKLPDPLGHLDLTEGYRPGDPGRYWGVPNVMSLSCLQWLLDKVKARTVIALA